MGFIAFCMFYHHIFTDCIHPLINEDMVKDITSKVCGATYILKLIWMAGKMHRSKGFV